MTNFLSLPRELRDQIYELVLLQQERIGPWSPWINDDQRQNLTSELLQVSKTIHREASSLFYGRNCFDLSVGTSEDVASFLGQIGQTNAEYIRYICVSFPEFLSLEPGAVTLEHDSAGILANLKSGCVNLSKLITSVSSKNAMELSLDALDNSKVTGEALALVNTHFRAILSLQEIIVEVYEDGLSDHARRVMKSHGWDY